MIKPIALLAGGLTAGAAIAWVAATDPATGSDVASSRAATPRPEDRDVARLTERVAELEARLDELLNERAGLPPYQPASDEGDEGDEAMSADGPAQRVAAGRVTAMRQRTGSANEARRRLLSTRGLTDGEIDLIFAFESERQLRNLEADWERRREAYLAGEINQGPRSTYFEELRTAVGDATFERYLAAQGVGLSIASVMPGTAAEYAGLQAGDVVQRYNGERVFTTGQLNALTVGGERGESVSIDVLRDGDMVTVTIPRGPIGVQTGRTRRPRP